jgi:membrane-bound metal-dependent hydrolase YbcI (DUF457 family)
MLRRTHLAIGVGTALNLLPHVNNEYLFFVIVMIATVLPEIDSGIPNLWKGWLSDKAEEGTSHRGFLHSYTFCIPASLVIAFIYPFAALPFFLGYSFHLFADSFTVEGIRPFWPWSRVSKGIVVNGSLVENSIFWTIVFVDILLFVLLFI